MGITTDYQCDLPGCTTAACNDADIEADQTAARQRVTLDANITYLDTSGESPTIRVKAMGQHVFCSLAHAITWAKSVTV